MQISSQQVVPRTWTWAGWNQPPQYCPAFYVPLQFTFNPEGQAPIESPALRFVDIVWKAVQIAGGVLIAVKTWQEIQKN